MEQHRECEGLFTGELHNEKLLESAQTGAEACRKRWSVLLIIVALSITIGLYVPVGYNIGVVNSPAEVIRSWCLESARTRYNVDLTYGQLTMLWSSIVSIFLIGGIIGSLTGSWLADFMGRKWACVFSGGLSFAGAFFFVITKFINSIEVLLLGRFVVGLSAGLTTCIAPMYLIELAPPYLTGAMGVFCQLGITLGVLLAQIFSLNQVLGDAELWPYLLSCYAVFIFLSAFTIPMLPESPKFLLLNRRRADALKQLERVRDDVPDIIEREIMEMEMHMQVATRQTQSSWNIAKVLCDRSLLLPVILVCAMQGGQQFSGINAVFYYSTLIFQHAGLSSEESQLATIGTGIINLLMACVSVFVMSYFKRRGVMQLSCLSSILCLLLLAFTITFVETYSWISYICIIAVLGYVLCYGIGLGPIPYFIGSELFEVGPRPSAMALGGMANYGGNFIVGLTFPLMQAKIGASSFIIFAAFTAGLLLLVRYYLPETKGRDPSEVANLCRNGLRSQVFASPSNSTVTGDTVPISEVKL
ncbi:hypothetical protein PPYR_11431 [Photinus pyralis]|uniref:Major facilitator superfamily (MFS) profile domain-containing protein n=1 Tax=Photinus pyralis TaxID=7054 RepID=A0A5N4AB98_PHOPY|nr:solute carrier family 2, facilitated glucose transporter member 1-like isoform X2 [Photinus pyralis]KAB0794592.1 hypothetical protein PPYR_11431 [Photinus pyralis]